jgi:hypothetical protein
MNQGPGPSCIAISMGSEYVSTRTYENLSAGDVNPGPISSWRGLHKGSLYREIWTGLSDLRLELGHTPRAWEPRNVLWTQSKGSEYILITYAVLFVQR